MVRSKHMSPNTARRAPCRYCGNDCRSLYRACAACRPLLELDWRCTPRAAIVTRQKPTQVEQALRLYYNGGRTHG